ncbi:hypothetical protein [Janibacter sp. LM]|uniref:hypothetical protein n=1 Tax=Janibacter sp. LM TaxID=3144845 RepID=UPI0031F618EF
MKNSTIFIPILGALSLSLSACGMIGGVPTTSTTTGSNRPQPSVTTVTQTTTATATAEPAGTQTVEPVDEPEPEAETSLTGTDPGILKLGSSFTYSDGLQLTLSKPTQFTPSEWAAPSSDPGLIFTVTMMNGTGAKFDPTLNSITAQIGNEEAEQIFDSENGLDGGPSTSILPGREVTYKAAFVGTDTKNLVVEIAPDWDHGALTFTPDGK